MLNLLIVDDEIPFLRNLSSYLGSFKDEFSVSTAASGEDALEVIESDQPIDVLLSDVRLPGIDGIELVRKSIIARPSLKVLVMTAFPSREIRMNATTAGAVRYMEKPLDLEELHTVLLEAGNASNGWSGSVGGLDLFDFTQLFTMSGKNTVLQVSYAGQKGVLVFKDGALIHASAESLEGDAAFNFMATWQGGIFNELPKSSAGNFATNVKTAASNLLMEAARMRDEAARDSPPITHIDELDLDDSTFDTFDQLIETTWEDRIMAITDHLEAFEDINGFLGAAVFTAQGEMLDGMAKGKLDIKTVGMFANNALLNAQKATDQMGVGRGNFVQIRAPKAFVIMRCLNEATDFAATKAGKAHFHTVVVMDPEGNTAMASMILDKIQEKIADEIR